MVVPRRASDPVWREEVFGPVVAVVPFDDEADANAQANDSDFGLAASVWSRDAAAAEAVARRLQVGTVWINESLHLSPGVAFGGHKQSGIGLENGLEGLLEYTLAQTITVRRSA